MVVPQATRAFASAGVAVVFLAAKCVSLPTDMNTRTNHNDGTDVRRLEQSNCSRLTPGTCSFADCYSWRMAECQSDWGMENYGRCICPMGFCATSEGFCVKDRGTLTAAVVPVNQRSPKFPGDRVDTALCISGGGSRSVAAALGQLRALHSLGLLTNVDLISGVSGGAWASGIYMFAQQRVDELLGPLTEPADLSLEALDELPALLGAVALNSTTSLAADLFSEDVPFQTLWTRMVAEAFLQPFGLDSLDKFIAASRSTVQDIVRRNPQLSEEDFLIMQPGRAKSVVFSATQLAPHGYTPSAENAVSFQVSPDFSGVPFYPDNSPVSYRRLLNDTEPDLEDVLVGGGLVETFALGGPAPKNSSLQGGGPTVELEGPMVPLSLARAMGMTSNAPAAVLSQHATPVLGEVLNPTMTLWPVINEDHTEAQAERTFEMGDGGNLENMGLLPALQRGARRIACMINTAIALELEIDYCSANSSTQPSGVSSQFTNKFGYLGSTGPSAFTSNNQVFASGDLFPILCSLQALKRDGRPLVWRGSLEVLSNSWWGISGGYTVDIAFFWLDESSQFEQMLPMETRQDIEQGENGGLENFPSFKTNFQNSLALTAYTARQVNLLAAQTEFSILQNREAFEDLYRSGSTSRSPETSATPGDLAELSETTAVLRNDTDVPETTAAPGTVTESPEATPTPTPTPAMPLPTPEDEVSSGATGVGLNLASFMVAVPMVWVSRCRFG